VLIRISHQGTGFPHHIGIAKCGVPRKGADDQLAFLNAMEVEFFKTVDVDEMFGSRHAKIHHGHKTLATRQDLGIVFVGCQKFDRLTD
jgi:hypothetical protein